MKVVAVVGPSDTGKTGLVERLVGALEGEVATVKHLTHPPERDGEGTDTARHRAAGAGTTYGLADGGTWFAEGEGWSLNATLETLAPDYDYAVLEGFSDATVPKLELGETESAGETLLAAPEADAVDTADAVAAIQDVEPVETLSSLVAAAKDSPAAERAGAVATFTGRVRAKDDPEDEETEYLEFEKYEGVAGERMAGISGEIESREGVFEVVMHHRVGVVEAGEDIVFVVVLAGHRAEAFAAVEDGIDRLKEEVPIFKKEVTVEGETWVDSHG